MTQLFENGVGNVHHSDTLVVLALCMRSLFDLTEINECDQYYRDHPSEAVCLNNGTCIDIINGFYCECRQIYEDLIIFGDRCDQST